MNVRTPVREAAIDVAEHRVLALEIRVLDVVAAGDEVGEPLDDDRLRRDRVGGDRPAARARRRRPLPRSAVRTVRPRGSGDHACTSSIAIASCTGQHGLADPAALAVEVVDRDRVAVARDRAFRAEERAERARVARLAEHRPVERPRAGLVPNRVERADGEEPRARAQPARERRLERAVAGEPVLLRAALVALARGEHVRLGDGGRRAADRIACSRKGRPPGRSRRTQAPRTATFPIGRPSADRMPSVARDPRRRDAGDGEGPGVWEARLAVENDEPARPDPGSVSGAGGAARRRRARRRRAPCTGGGSAARPSAGRRRSALRAARP